MTVDRFGGAYARPLAAAPWKSYRYLGPYGGIAIGAFDDADALVQASRSLDGGGKPTLANLERWSGEAWERCA